MAEVREKLLEVLKVLGFVALGFIGGFIAKPFVDGFMDGFNESVQQSRELPEQESELSDSANDPP